MAISFGLVLLCNGFIQLRLDHFLERTAFLNDAVEIGAKWSVDEVSIGLFDCAFLEVVSYLDIALFLPCRSLLLKTGMQEGKDQSSFLFQ